MAFSSLRDFLAKAEQEGQLLRITEEVRPEPDIRAIAYAAAKVPRGRGGEARPPVPLDEAASERFAALKGWRAGVAREHNLPAYIVFHDAALAEMARLRPATLDELAAISGVGARKLAAYGDDILRLLAAASR